MRRLTLCLIALAATLPLAGCYYDPDYGYVRNGTGGDAYYGTETTTVVSPGYVDPGFGYYDGYGYGPGCCYSTIGVGTVWYHDRYPGYYGRDWHGRPPPGGWHGGGWRGPPPGGWRGGGHGPPPGGWHGGGGHGPPPGGWHGGGGRPSGGWHGGNGGNWHHDGH
ncbi:hypothetical protein KR767_18300 [Luteibacter anthropi]|uniref:Lipoprotein n=1 Tax=Luteibacter anthropi TaxID=564369 RepID=A0A7X5U8E4_9GAMM|nr:hypothetical protein [Luteibacter anthropi]NII05761.1 hypothetical protein [Luteibacter anthropi]URX61974.1 hypothetical protein KR767_18300 [Luteibacter anthropi]